MVIETSEELLRVPSGRDEIEECVDSIVTEARVTLNSRFFGKNVIVLSLEISNNFLEASEQRVKHPKFGCRKNSKHT